MAYLEDVVHSLLPSLRTEDEAQKKTLREAWAADVLPKIVVNVERLLKENGNTGYLVGK